MGQHGKLGDKNLESSMTPADIQLAIRSKLNELRALDRIVNSVEFLQCFHLNPNDSMLEAAIINADLELIREWMDNTISQELCELGIRQLRAMAGQLGIKQYTILTKDDLLIQIVQAKNELRKSKESVVGMSHSANNAQAVSS